MVQDSVICNAVSKILQRTERQQDYEKIIDTFVDIGIIDQLKNNNNQIIYGRRGTGKTHILKVLEQSILDTPNTISLYIDCRVLGSSSQFTDTTKTISTRCISLFKDILYVINQTLLDYIVTVDYEEKIRDKAFDILNELQNAILEPKREYAEQEVTVSAKGNHERGLKIGIKGKAIEGEYGIKRVTEEAQEAKYQVHTENKVYFPEINNFYNEFLKLVGKHFYILIDEWAALPQDIQPYLAELLKRGIIPNSDITIKIASLEYRSNFNIQIDKYICGFELGSDISANTDIDDYYVYDRNPDVITEAFADVLYKHIGIELPDNYQQDMYRVNNHNEMIAAMFNSSDAFGEIVRASEGVIRDLINIFTRAYFDSQRKKKDKIEKNTVLESAQQWFEQDKERNLSEDLRIILKRMVTEMIGSRKARSFLIPKELETNQYIRQLFDLRVLHLVRRGYADKDNPGERYNIYTLDYGTYVDLLKTSKKPLNEYAVEEKESTEMIVPFDDKRSIRRIVLREELLKIE